MIFSSKDGISQYARRMFIACSDSTPVTVLFSVFVPIGVRLSGQYGDQVTFLQFANQILEMLLLENSVARGTSIVDTCGVILVRAFSYTIFQALAR
jgi:hypothetical protein